MEKDIKDIQNVDETEVLDQDIKTYEPIHVSEEDKKSFLADIDEDYVYKMKEKLDELRLDGSNEYVRDFDEKLDSWYRKAIRRGLAIQDYETFYKTNADPNRLCLNPVASTDERTDYSIINSLPNNSRVKELAKGITNVEILLTRLKEAYQNGKILHKKSYSELIDKYSTEYEQLYNEYISEVMKIIVPIRIAAGQSDLIPLDKRDELNEHIERIENYNDLLAIDVSSMKKVYNRARLKYYSTRLERKAASFSKKIGNNRKNKR